MNLKFHNFQDNPNDLNIIPQYLNDSKQEIESTK